MGIVVVAVLCFAIGLVTPKAWTEFRDQLRAWRDRESSDLAVTEVAVDQTRLADQVVANTTVVKHQASILAGDDPALQDALDGYGRQFLAMNRKYFEE
ncbi:MAG: hypothetical protein WA991_04040 [Ornithinimicrobium sp.]